MFAPCQDGHQFRQEHGLVGKFVVLYAGAHGISNDLEVILQAAKQLSALDTIRFVFIGDGKEKNNLVALSKDLGIHNVVFLPPIPKSEIPIALAAADACIAILKPIDMYKTTYPNKVFDYMAAGRAVILAIDGVIREVVEDAGAGNLRFSREPGATGACCSPIIECAANLPPDGISRPSVHQRIVFT